MPNETTRFPDMRVLRFPDNEIGIRISGTEYIMPIAQANELVGMINAARYSEPLNWAGTAPEAESDV